MFTKWLIVMYVLFLINIQFCFTYAENVSTPAHETLKKDAKENTDLPPAPLPPGLSTTTTISTPTTVYPTNHSTTPSAKPDTTTSSKTDPTTTNKPETTTKTDTTTTMKPDTTTSVTSTTTTTPTKSTSTSTSAPTQTTSNSPSTTEEPSKDRRFDGPSFIGGIVLSVGIMAIAFVSWKFYKARSERNYHTL